MKKEYKLSATESIMVDAVREKKKIGKAILKQNPEIDALVNSAGEFLKGFLPPEVQAELKKNKELKHLVVGSIAEMLPKRAEEPQTGFGFPAQGEA